MMNSKYTHDAVELLKELIATPSVSRQESEAADVLARHISKLGLKHKREANNIFIPDPFYDNTRPTILLNAHIDTVKPVSSWTRNPYTPTVEGDFIYGLGSNDCGGGLVALLSIFRHFIDKNRTYNLIYLASAEEEISGKNGIRRVLPLLPKIDVAIVGEPTNMQPAVAEKGLMVLDVVAQGRSGHAARCEGVNAIYQALKDLNWFSSYQFSKTSDLLGETLMNVTMINAGTQHNILPDECRMVVDIRTNEHYTNREVYDIICANVQSQVTARSFNLCSSRIDLSHPLIKKCLKMGLTPFGSPTLSDQSLMPFPSFKLGPGSSSRSHTADEYIKISEISQAIATYIDLLDGATIV